LFNSLAVSAAELAEREEVSGALAYEVEPYPEIVMGHWLWQLVSMSYPV
jgi:hypothetical protein